MKTNLNGRNKRWIRPLPERLINKIAAGEVIERPAAVMKELVENSLDAGATRIDIIAEKSGMKMISVLDNGCGIDAEQIEVAFSRHATSKISNFDDLEALYSFGFRGEALPSIGSVSKTRMVSRTADSEVGQEIIIEGGVVQNVKPIGASVGTRVEVADLFFNTPARRKFLKSDATESRHLTRSATAMALGAIGVRFSYTVNGRKLFILDDNASNLKNRISHLLSGGGGGEFFEVEYESEFINIGGYLSYMDNCRKNRYGLYMFINGRYINSPTMIHAVIAGYGELLPRGNFPVGAVFLNVDPSRVDVNVHPTKAEVRLSDEKQIHDLLYQSIKRALHSSPDVRPGSHVIEGATFQKLTAKDAIGRLKTFSTPAISDNNSSLIKELYEDKLPKPATDTKLTEQSELHKQDLSTVLEKTPFISQQMDLSGFIYLGQLAGLYLLFKNNDDLVIVDQHTAHERVLYEQHLESIESGQTISQTLLFPINIDLPADQYAVFEEALEILRTAGFIIEPFGTRTVFLSAVPSALTKKSPEKMFSEIMSDVENLNKEGKELRKAVAQSIACRAAIMAGDKLTEKEAMTLMKNLLSAKNQHSCPHGRPIMLKINRSELDAKFGRR